MTRSRYIRLYVLLSALFVCFTPARAQWYGSLDIYGGIGALPGNGITMDKDKYMFRGLAGGEVIIGKRTDSFTWKTTINGKFEPKTTDNVRFQATNLSNDNSTAETIGLVYKVSSQKPVKALVRSDLLWTPDIYRNYSVWMLYQYENDTAENTSMNIDGSIDMMDLSAILENPIKNDHKLEAGVKTFRSFNSGLNILESSLSLKYLYSNRYNIWASLKSKDGEGTGTHVAVDGIDMYGWAYRITPTSNDIDTKGDIHLRLNIPSDALSLSITPGIRGELQHFLDRNSGATFVYNPQTEEGAWRDSVRLRENFNFLSLKAESYLVADLQWWNIEAHADIATQVYGRRLNNEEQRQPFRIKGIYPVGKSNVKWNITPHHSLNLKNEMSVKHPDYLKVCWYDRTAGYLDQLYRGNEQLRSPHTMITGLEYQFKYNRFVSKTGVSYKQIQDEIDQTWSNMTIEGREYKVFEWINSADSRALGLVQNFGWHGKVIDANAEISYNNTRRIAKDKGTFKDNFDWCLKGDITAFLGKGWSIGTKVKYQSKVATFYTLFKEYCELSAKINKDFKHFSIYLEGKDLLDSPVVTEFYSEDKNEYWIEEIRKNRRMVILGLKWSF